MMLHTKYQESGPKRFSTRTFSKMSLYISLWESCDPWDVASFNPSGIICTILVEGHHMMLQTKYQGSGPSGFRQEDFKRFPYISQCKKGDPQGLANFDPRCII